MALTILPSDGFITRLLQQAHHAAPAPQAGAGKPAMQQQPDQMSISNEGRQATATTGNHQLESKLMELYNQRGQGSN